jgi:hypothetical protein
MRIKTAKYLSGTTKPNSVIILTYEGQTNDQMITVSTSDPQNFYYGKVLKWVAEGNKIEEAD